LKLELPESQAAMTHLHMNAMSASYGSSKLSPPILSATTKGGPSYSSLGIMLRFVPKKIANLIGQSRDFRFAAFPDALKI
jgi:hypothetical protein